MDCVYARNKINIFFIFFIILLMGAVFCTTPARALDPTITDVTTRSFSVVWTEDGTITDLGKYSLSIEDPNNELLKEYTTTGDVSGDANQIDIRMESDADALARRIYKFEVIGLGIDRKYRCQGTKSNGTTPLFSGSYIEVDTQKVIGLDNPYADANDNDIVTNDIVHLAVYNTDGVTPALGAMVMAEIYSDAECTDPNRLSGSFTGWVGVGLPGDPSDSDYLAGIYTNPNTLSYKEYAALNLNNVFGLDKYPLQLTGESEYIKVIVIGLASEVIYKIPVPKITEVETGGVSQKISSAKVAVEIKFASSLNVFTYPCDIPDNYTTVDLFKAVESANGDIGYILSYTGGDWTKTEKTIHPKTGEIQYVGPVTIEPGKGYIVMMQTAMEEGFFISGYPSAVQMQLSSGMNIAGFPQIPSFYTTKNLLLSINKNSAEGLDYMLTYESGDWTKTEKTIHPKTGEIQYVGEMPMASGKGLFIFQNQTCSDLDPLGQ